MHSHQDITALARSLLEAVARLHPLQPAPAFAEAREAQSLRESILLSLRLKILPELEARSDLPVFVGVQGGTNVGKSTVFNALAGHLLSPAVVQASATKHPLVFAHEKWRSRLLDDAAFPGLDCRELQDPKELIVDAERTELLLFRFHTENQLADLALIDSPDFDSALDSNLKVARYVTVLSDLTVFVTTAQKYKDRELVSHLRLLEDLKASVVLVFNMLDEEIVYKTLLDDLRTEVSLPEGELVAMRIPRSAASHPEDEIRDRIVACVLEHLSSHRAADVKPLLIRRTIRRALEQVTDLTALFAAELDLKERFARSVEGGLREAVAGYEKSFSLALPEETLAVRKLLRVTELWPHLELASDVRDSNTPLRAIAAGLGRTSEFVRRVLLRFSGKGEGSIEESATAAMEYAQARNEADFAEVSRHAQTYRQTLETFLRDCEKTSPLAREVLSKFFNPDRTRQFAGGLRREFDKAVQDGRGEGENVLERVDAWLEENAFTRRLLMLGAMAFKLFAGWLVAYALPPRGLLAVLNWLEFALGYLLGAYVIALAVSLAVRKKKRFRRARVRGMRSVLETTLARPLSELVEDILEEENLQTIEKTAGALREAADSPEAR